MLACQIGTRSVAIQRTINGPDSSSSCQHTCTETSGSCKAPVQAGKCGVLAKLIVPLLVVYSNMSPGLRACLWRGRTSRHGDFLAAWPRWLHGSCSSRCAGAVFKPACLCPCGPLTVLCVLCHIPTATARRRHKTTCLRSVLYRVRAHCVRLGA